MPESPQLADIIADEVTDAIFQTKTAMTARKETMLQKHVRDCVRGVLVRRLPVAPPVGPSRGKKAPPGPFGDRKAIPPTAEQVGAYSASIGYPLDGAKWCDFYAAKGWSVGKTRMKDWQAAVRNWKTNGWGAGSVTLGPTKPKPTESYDKI